MANPKVTISEETKSRIFMIAGQGLVANDSLAVEEAVRLLDALMPADRNTRVQLKSYVDELIAKVNSLSNDAGNEDVADNPDEGSCE